MVNNALGTYVIPTWGTEAPRTAGAPLLAYGVLKIMRAFAFEVKPEPVTGMTCGVPDDVVTLGTIGEPYESSQLCCKPDSVTT